MWKYPVLLLLPFKNLVQNFLILNAWTRCNMEQSPLNPGAAGMPQSYDMMHTANHPDFYHRPYTCVFLEDLTIDPFFL